jgi:hypothetical protein
LQIPFYYKHSSIPSPAVNTWFVLAVFLLLL